MKLMVTLTLLVASQCLACPYLNYSDESLLIDNQPLAQIFASFKLRGAVTDESFREMLHSLEALGCQHHRDEHVSHDHQPMNGSSSGIEDGHHDLNNGSSGHTDEIGHNLLSQLLLDENLTLNDSVTPLKLLQICPNILLNILKNGLNDEKTQSSHQNSVTTSHKSHQHGAKQNHIETTAKESWMGSLISMAIIGFISMCCIMVIPFLKTTRFYSAINHFLLSLAVGSLAGDALIHLIPHAMTMNVGDSSNVHLTHALYGFTAFMGILVFLIMERLHNLIGHKHSHGYPHSHDIDSDDMIKELGIISTDLNHPKLISPEEQNAVRILPMSPIGSSFHDSASTTDRKACFDSCPNMVDNGDEPASNGTGNKSCRSKLNSHVSVAPETEKLMPKVDINVQKKDELTAVSSTPLNISLQQKSFVRRDSKNFNMVLQEYHVGHHGHSHHGHSHVTGRKNSLRTMILLGDGMHTIMDGMAIGVAFGTSLTGGVATAIAVLCHELPHKLGDFAILFEMGMNVSQAIKMAIFLWLLSFVGSAIGVAVGSVHTISPWIYCFTAGVFLYLALVDLLSEISINGGEMCTAGKQMALQLAGMLTGAAIMMIIAIYEHDLESLLADAF